MRPEVLDRIDAIVQQGLDEHRMPGCVVAIGRRDYLVFRRAYGAKRLEPEHEAMTVDTVFDLASLTKPIATATSVMALWEQGRFKLSDPVSTYLPDFTGNEKESITIAQLLTHQAGLIPDNALEDYQHGTDAAWKKICELGLQASPGERFIYSDVGFIVLGRLVETLAAERLDEFARRTIFAPAAMNETTFLPPDPLRARAAPTQQREGRWMVGEVHDPRAFLLNGVAGHAGLFSTADDLARYAQMMLNHGIAGNNPILSPATVRHMTSDVTIVEEGRSTVRGYGWDKRSGYSSNRGENFSATAFGHGGFTGTVIWIDPELDLFFIFLSNRVHPDGQGSVNALAGRIGTVAAAAIASSPKLPANKLDSQPSASTVPLETGFGVLHQERFKRLAGQKIGLITNHTGITRDGTSIIAELHQADEVDLRAIFSPEHGIAGKLDQASIDDGQDSLTGLPIYSLYGASRKPTAEQLESLDTLVFDIQDIGCRFYTYISTMGLAMEAAAEHGKRFVVLDRPNPINGVDVGGPLLDSGSESFVGYHRLPVRHGMTVGELARMIREERGLQVQLEVVPMAGWQRDQWFDELHLPWVNPSPNMRTMNAAILYPGVGLLETTNLSVGRGTDTPFELFGAPWMDAVELSHRLTNLSVPGIRFMPREFTPTSSVYAGENCRGLQLEITNRDQFDPCRFGLAVALALHEQHADRWKFDGYQRLLGNRHVWERIGKDADFAEVWKLLERDRVEFLQRRQTFLLY
jgi:uncharacterized protein YbbC (DUF1343 family)/CubicO group peptidase (beta-lactamase class C family)